MKVSELIDILKSVPKDSVILCGGYTDTLYIVSGNDKGDLVFKSMLIGTRGSELVYVPVFDLSKPKEIV